MLHISRDGHSIAVHGTEAVPCVLLLHAFPLSHAMWREQLHHLGGRARVIAPDLGGFGASTRTGTATMAALADDMVAVLDALAVRDALVAGVSMGGYVALALHARHPERVGALLLADTRAEADSPEVAAGRELSARRALAEGPAALAPELAVRLLGATTQRERPELCAEVSGWIASAPAGAFAGAQRGMAERDDLRGELPRVRVPASVIVGAEDTLTPPALSRAMAAAIPGATLHELPGAGHLAQLEAPAAWNAALDALLARYIESPPSTSMVRPLK